VVLKKPTRLTMFKTLNKLIVVTLCVSISKFVFEVYCLPNGGHVGGDYISQYTPLLPRSLFSVF
jgi:hypothetical protein